MSTTKQRSGSKERFWRRVVRQWRHSGLSIRDFCVQQQLSEASFYFWRRTIGKRDGQAARFVPVQVVGSEEKPTASDTAGQGLELVLGGGWVLRIGPDFDGPALQRLLALLAEDRP